MNFGLRFAENGASRVTRQTWTTVNVSENCYNLAETRCIREYGIKIFTCYRQVRHPRLFQACGYRLVTHSIHYHCAQDGDRAGVVGPAAHVARYGAGAILLVDTASIQWHAHYRRYCTSGYPVPGSQFPVLSSRFSVPGSQFLVLSSWFSVPGSQFPVLGSWFSVPGSRFLVLSSHSPTTAAAAPSTLPVFGRAHQVLPGCSRYAS
jgi:hypothetical protein